VHKGNVVNLKAITTHNISVGFGSEC